MASLARTMAPFRQAVRGYATQGGKSVAPPLQLSGLPGKYASALFTAAAKKDEKTLAAVEKDFQSLQKLLASKDGGPIKAFLENPTLQPSERKKGIDGLLKGLGGTPSELTRNTFEVLAENGRMADAEKVGEDFLSLMSAHRGEINITIWSAQPLDSSTQSRLEKTLKQSNAAQGKTVKIKNTVNPSVLGGLVVDFGEKTVDLSVASKVNRMNSLLTQSV